MTLIFVIPEDFFRESKMESSMDWTHKPWTDRYLLESSNLDNISFAQTMAG